jgi:hypothetical protein
MLESRPVPVPSVGLLSKQPTDAEPHECKESADVPYRQAVGSLWYAANCTRPDITFATNSVAQFAQCHGPEHWIAVKRIFRYLAGTVERGITYSKSAGIKITAYCDSDWGNDPETRRSKTGYVIIVAGGVIAWQTKAQKSVALSSCEAELYALCEAVKEIMWLSSFLTELGVQFELPILHCDNRGAIALAQNPVGHQRSKHINIRYYFVREAIANGVLKVEYVATSENLADIFTKSTVAVVFSKHVAVVVSVISK